MTSNNIKNSILHEMIQAGIHFGHSKSEWNPKMLPYIYREKNGIHIIDIIQTYYYVQTVSQILEKAATQGKTFLFVGTKKQASQTVKQIAQECNTFFVNKRWLGGLLTNWLNINKSIIRLNALQNIDKFKYLSKKEYTRLQNKRKRLEKYVGGLTQMTRLPDIVIIIGQTRELNAVYECRKLGLRTVTILDTNCNPLLTDLFIPANDDSIQSIKWILNKLAASINKGYLRYNLLQQKKNTQRRRLSRNKKSQLQK